MSREQRRRMREHEEQYKAVRKEIQAGNFDAATEILKELRGKLSSNRGFRSLDALTTVLREQPDHSDWLGAQNLEREIHKRSHAQLIGALSVSGAAEKVIQAKLENRTPENIEATAAFIESLPDELKFEYPLSLFDVEPTLLPVWNALERLVSLPLKVIALQVEAYLKTEDVAQATEKFATLFSETASKAISRDHFEQIAQFVIENAGTVDEAAFKTIWSQRISEFDTRHRFSNLLGQSIDSMIELDVATDRFIRAAEADAKDRRVAEYAVPITTRLSDLVRQSNTFADRNELAVLEKLANLVASGRLGDDVVIENSKFTCIAGQENVAAELRRLVSDAGAPDLERDYELATMTLETWFADLPDFPRLSGRLLDAQFYRGQLGARRIAAGIAEGASEVIKTTLDDLRVASASFELVGRGEDALYARQLEARVRYLTRADFPLDR